MKKSLKINYIYNLMYQILTMFLPLIVTPYLSRTLGAEKIGIYSFTMSILSYFVLFGCIGINLYGQREIAIVQNDKEKRSKIFYELVLLKFFMLILSFFVFALLNFNNPTYGIYYKILSIELFSNVIDITWLFQGLENFKKITIRNTIVRFVSIIFIFLFVKNSDDLVIYFFINCLVNFIGFSTLWFNLKQYINKPKFKTLNLFKHLKPTIALFIPQIAIQIYTVLDKTMLGYILDDMAEVGYYEQSQKIVKLCLMLITALGTVMIPRIASLYANNEQEELNEKIFKVFNIVSIIGFPMCFGLIAISKNFVPWFFGQEFLPIINLLIVFSFLILGIGFNNITGMQYLIPTKNQNKFTISVIIGAIVNLVLNFILIPNLKSIGAAIATVVAEFVIFIVQAIYLRNVFDFKNIFKTNIKYLAYSLIMFIASYFVGMFLNANILSTIIQCIVGVGVYMLLLLVFKDKFLLDILKTVKQKFRRN